MDRIENLPFLDVSTNEHVGCEAKDKIDHYLNPDHPNIAVPGILSSFSGAQRLSDCFDNGKKGQSHEEAEKTEATSLLPVTTCSPMDSEDISTALG